MSIFGPKKIGLALGSGSARGLAHIGVLKVLEAEGLVPDAIAGTSMGALIGAFYAAGYPAADLERIATGFDVKTITSMSDVAFGKGAVLSGEKVVAFLNEYLPATFEELRIPFGCVATDVTRNAPVRFTSGDLVSAVRASISVPLAFLPVRMDDMLLIDGYVMEPVPVTLARRLGGEAIVAVDVHGSGIVNIAPEANPGMAKRIQEFRAMAKGDMPYQRGSSGMDIVGAVSESFEARITREELLHASVVISPEVHDFNGFDYGQTPGLIAAGEDAARAAAPAVHRVTRR